jgi:RNA polymerase sigma-70 factor (ECF subfamily)
MNLTDFYLQKKIQDGDIREFERLFVKYYEPLCQHASKILKDIDTAEDIVQEFFYNFWKNRETFSPKLSLNAYLYHSIRNNALHHLEHMAVREKYAEQMIGEFKDEIPLEEQQEVEMKELGTVINATLQQMPERCALVFRMNRFEGKKYREIAEILSISVKTVEADMGKALQLFRKTLKEFSGEHARISN